MSADNYEVVWRDPHGGYRVTVEFASDEASFELERDGKLRGRWFATLAEADAYAHEEYSEYGVLYQFKTEIHDTQSEGKG